MKQIKLNADISWKACSLVSKERSCFAAFFHIWFLRIISAIWICFFVMILGCTSEHRIEQNKLMQQEKESAAAHSIHTEVGEASWYGPGFHGKRTASGEVFDQTKMTAAHPSLPMGTKAQITNLANDEKVEVRINDRGPYAKDRVIDVSRAAAKKLDMHKDGTAQVKIETKHTDKKDSVD